MTEYIDPEGRIKVDALSTQATGSTPGCNCASNGLVDWSRHSLGCPYGQKLSRVAAHEREHGAPESWEGHPGPATNEMREGVTPAVILPPMPLRLLLETSGIDPDQVSELVIECAWWHKPKISFKYRDKIERVDITLTLPKEEEKDKPAYYKVRVESGEEGRRRYESFGDAHALAQRLGGEGMIIVAYNKHQKIMWERKVVGNETSREERGTE